MPNPPFMWIDFLVPENASLKFWGESYGSPDWALQRALLIFWRPGTPYPGTWPPGAQPEGVEDYRLGDITPGQGGGPNPYLQVVNLPESRMLRVFPYVQWGGFDHVLSVHNSGDYINQYFDMTPWNGVDTNTTVIGYNPKGVSTYPQGDGRYEVRVEFIMAHDKASGEIPGEGG